MTSNIVNLDDFREHVEVELLDGSVRIIPLKTLSEVAVGNTELDTIDDYGPLMQTILHDWLDFIKPK